MQSTTQIVQLRETERKFTFKTYIIGKTLTYIQEMLNNNNLRLFIF